MFVIGLILIILHCIILVWWIFSDNLSDNPIPAMIAILMLVIGWLLIVSSMGKPERHLENVKSYHIEQTVTYKDNVAVDTVYTIYYKK